MNSQDCRSDAIGPRNFWLFGSVIPKTLAIVAYVTKAVPLRRYLHRKQSIVEPSAWEASAHLCIKSYLVIMY